MIKKPRKELNMKMIQQLQRINKGALEKHKFYQERNQHLKDMIKKQKQSTYRSEYDRLEAQRVKSGALGVEAHNRLTLLKALIK